ncbi:MAG: hypothetical protein ABI761_15850 [Saprospiraceae bacterium]
MASLDQRSTISNLAKKGFVLSQKKGKDHIWLEFWYNGKISQAITKFSHNYQDLDDHLISRISKQIFLNKIEFLDLVKCPLSQDGYVVILKNKGIL